MIIMMMTTKSVRGRCCLPLMSVVFVVLCARVSDCGLVNGEQVAFVRVSVLQEDISSVLKGQALHTQHTKQHQSIEEQELRGDLRLIDSGGVRNSLQNDDDDVKGERSKLWIGVVPVQVEGHVPNNNQKSFTSSVVNKIKRALVLGASALIILVLNQNTLREMDVSQLLSKPIIIIQNSENVTKLFSALIRGLHATARITYQTFLQSNLVNCNTHTHYMNWLCVCQGATLTLWSSCGHSRWGRYGEWQGVVCTGETNSPVQKYLQQLWNTVVLVVLIFSTGVLLHARWQHYDHQLSEQIQLHPKQELLNKLSVLKTRRYREMIPVELDTDNCAVCLESYSTNQCLRILPCLHEFHRDCVDPWLLLQQTCPLCKRSVLGNFSSF